MGRYDWVGRLLARSTGRSKQAPLRKWMKPNRFWCMPEVRAAIHQYNADWVDGQEGG